MTDKASTPSPVLGYDEIADRLIPSDPQISPDGKHVAFTVSTANRTKDGKSRAIWLSRNRGVATRFTGGDADNQSPRWSPDGKKLLFIANRKDVDKEALFLLPVDGGEAKRLGDLEGSLSDPSWSPDGKLIAVIRTDPETDAEKKKREDKDDPIVYEEDTKHARIWIIDAESGDARQLTYGDLSVWNYAWSPDGGTIIFISTAFHVINELIRKQSLWRIPTSGGVRAHLADFKDGTGAPIIREADGVPVVAIPAGDHRNDPSVSIWTIPLAGGEKKNILPGYPGSVTSIVADPADPSQIIARVVTGTHQRLYRIGAAGGELVSITPANLASRGSVESDPTLSNDGATIALTWSASDYPEEVYCADLGEEEICLTSFGKPFKNRLQPGEVVQWESTDGVTIEGILIKPAGYVEGNRVPLLVEIHGGPSWQWEDRVMLDWHDWAQLLASRGYAILLPNPRGSTGYGRDFEKLLHDDVGGGEAQDVISGALAMVERGIADPERLGIGGWSWGGYLTAWTITQTTIFKAGMMGAGVANLISDHAAGDVTEANMMLYPGHPYSEWDLYARASPVRFAANVVTPTLILHGDSDIRVSPTQGQEYYRALKEIGVPVRFVRYPREGHGFQERAHQVDLMRRIVDWFEKYIPVS